MDKQEARAIVSEKLSEYRKQSYVELQRLLTAQDIFETTGPSGKWYPMEFCAMWDDKPNNNLRVRGAIDDGRIRAFFPLCEDFIMAPDGSFVGE
jgi:hypothetical protein